MCCKSIGLVLQTSWNACPRKGGGGATHVKTSLFCSAFARTRQGGNSGCGFFAYSWKLPAYSGAFLLTVDTFSFFAYSWSYCACNFSFFTYNWSFFAYNGKVRLIRALRDCKQRSLTVSKKAPTASEKNFLRQFAPWKWTSLQAACFCLVSFQHLFSGEEHCIC